MGSEIMTINEVAEYLHLHRTTIYGLLKRRELAGFRLAGAGHWRFTRDEIDLWRTDAERKTRQQADQKTKPYNSQVLPIMR